MPPIAPRRVRGLVSVGFLLLWSILGAAPCPSPGPLEIVSPEPSEVVSSAAVPVEVRLDPELVDPASLVVLLNGEPVPVEGGPEVFTASVGPGFPLARSNKLTALANLLVGAPLSWSHGFLYEPPRARARRSAAHHPRVKRCRSRRSRR